MGELSEMLGVTGMVATVLSVFFALAALYVQRRRKSLAKEATAVKEAASPVTKASVGVPEEEIPAESGKGLFLHNHHGFVEFEGVTESVSLFKRYMPVNGKKVPLATSEENNYTWS
jgi:hypothetical protein